VFGQGPIGEGPENVMHLFAGLSALSILLFGTVKEEGKRALLILGSCVVVANILVSQKRDPQVGLLIGIAVIAWRLPSKQKLQWALRAVGVLLLILAIGAFRQPASSGAGFADSISRYYEVVNFIEAPSIQVDPGDTILFHLFDIADGWERVKQKPLLGFGFGGQTERNLTQLSEAGGEYVGTGIIHNQYLTFWLKMGIAGPILFFWLLISFLTFCGKAIKNTPLSTPVALGIGIYASLWADIAMEFWAAGWVGNTKTPIIIFLSFALAVGLLGRNVSQFPNRVNGRHA
jgi:O-antigen ligase